MSYCLIQEGTLSNIADAIRLKDGLSTKMTPLEMASRINNIPSGGGGDDLKSIIERTITSLDYSGNYIGNNAFCSCSSLTTISLPNCSFISNLAFAYCYSLATISLPNCSYIGSYAFKSCYSLVSINLPECSYVGSNAFYSCISLTTISLSKVSYIGSYAFYGCSSLRSVYILTSSVPTLSSTNAFTNTPMSNSSYIGLFGSIYVLSSMVNAFKGAGNWKIYSNRMVGI